MAAQTANIQIGKHPTGTTRGGLSLWAKFKRDRFLYLLALPGILYFIIFKYIPLWGLTIAFQDYSPYDGIFGSEWVGFQHFIRFFTNNDFWLLLRNTLTISLANLIFFFPVPIILSLLLNEVGNQGFKRVVQTVVYLPHFLSWVIIFGITYLMVSSSEGLINKALVSMGFQSIDFLTNPDLFVFNVTLQAIWKEAGWGTVIFLASIAGIDPSLYESAKMDGASRLRQIWHITLPCIRHVVIVLLILRMGKIIDLSFDQIYLMMNGAVSEVADIFETYVYRNGIQQGDFSYGTAVGLFKSIVGTTLVLATNKLSKMFGEEGLY